MNETHASVTNNSATRQREYTKLGRLEGSLRRARVAIKEAKFQNKTHDADYIPNGPMYWNAHAFHRYHHSNLRHYYHIYI